MATQTSSGSIRVTLPESVRERPDVLHDFFLEFLNTRSDFGAKRRVTTAKHVDEKLVFTAVIDEILFLVIAVKIYNGQYEIKITSHSLIEVKEKAAQLLQTIRDLFTNFLTAHKL